MTDVEDFFALIFRIENAMNDPYQVVIKKEGEAAPEEEKADVDMEEGDEPNRKRRKIQFFKFWPKHVLREQWQKYLSLGETGRNLNAAYLAIQILDKVTTQFTIGQAAKLDKKAAKIGQQ